MFRLRRATFCKILVLPLALVALFSTLYLRTDSKIDPNSSSAAATTKKVGVRGSTSHDGGDDEADEEGPPQPPPPPLPIQVKSVSEVQDHIQGGASSSHLYGSVDAADTVAMARRHPPLHFYTQDSTQILFQDYRYRFPSQAFFNVSTSSDAAIVVVGVLSAPEHVSRRNVIRQTWAYQRSNVFFLVGGPWEALEEEIRYHHDVFWIDVPEGASNLVLKADTYFVAVHKHLPNFQFALKTDDDSYIRLDDLERQVTQKRNEPALRAVDSQPESGSSSSSDDEGSGDTYGSGDGGFETDNDDGDEEDEVWSDVDYIGSCVVNRPIDTNQNDPNFHGLLVASGGPRFPTYASGAGYLISSGFAGCLARLLPTAPMLSTIEDVNTGLLAQSCQTTCHHSNRFLNLPDASLLDPQSTSNYLVAHYLEQYADTEIENIMITLHAHTCSRVEAASDVSCGEGSLKTAPVLPSPRVPPPPDFNAPLQPPPPPPAQVGGMPLDHDMGSGNTGGFPMNGNNVGGGFPMDVGGDPVDDGNVGHFPTVNDNAGDSSMPMTDPTDGADDPPAPGADVSDVSPTGASDNLSSGNNIENPASAGWDDAGNNDDETNNYDDDAVEDDGGSFDS